MNPFEENEDTRPWTEQEKRMLSGLESKMEALRDQFAMQALTAIILSEKKYWELNTIGKARIAYQFAEAMLVAREEAKS